MDILLTKFVQKHIDTLDIDQLNELDKFLDFEDETIYNFYQFDRISQSIDKNKISKIFKKFKI